MANFFKHTTKDNLKNNLKKATKKVVRTGLGGPATVAYDILANPTAANVYTQEDLDYARQMYFMKHAKPIARNKKFNKKSKKNKKGPR